jgi:hypothetical protein
MVLARTHTRTHAHVIFANPYLTCNQSDRPLVAA